MTRPEQPGLAGVRPTDEGSPSDPVQGDLEDQRLFSSIRGRLFGREGAVSIGRYQLEGRLGAGAMGEVFLARDPDLDRLVAIKLVHPHLADERFAARLRREAKALARLVHPNVVRVYEVGEHEGRVFLAMEYVRGGSLRAWIAEQRPSWPQVLEAYVQAGRGLAAAHHAGLTHRDFKPDNVLRGDDGRILVADFGLASLDGGVVGAREAAWSAGMSTDPEMPLTGLVLSQTGEIKGTPAYMPPEQFRGLPLDGRADQFAFCVAVYEGFWGTRPFAEESLRARMTATLRGPQVPSERRGVPDWVWPVLERGLAHEVDERWASMEELLEALGSIPRRRRRRRQAIVLGLGLGVTAGAAGVLGAAWQSGPAVVEASCADVGEGLRRVWGDDARAEIERSFSATALPWADDTSRRVIEALDAWSGRWVDVGVQLCEAGRSGEDRLLLARQSACLEQRRGQLDALVSVLQVAEPDTMQEAIAAVGQLDGPESCVDDPSALVLPPAPPAALREDVERLGRRLDEIEATIRTAQYSEARDALVVIEPAVEETGYDPLRARLLELRGRALLWGGQREEGVAALERAADLAEGSRDDARLASAWRYLALHAMSEARDPGSGTPWLRRAEASARRLGVDPKRSGELATIRGHRALLTNELEQAEQEFRTAIDDLAARGRAYRLVDARHALGDVLVLRGRPTEAVDELDLAQRDAERSFGPHHPVYGAITYDMGAALLGLGRTEQAQAQLDTAIAIWTDSYREPHPDLGMAHILRAGIELAAGHVEQAETEVDAAEQILRATRPTGHPELGDLASARAAVAFAQGDFPRARLALDEVIAIYREAFGAEDPYLAKVTAERGWVWIALGEVDAAERDFAAANEALRTTEDLAIMRTPSLVGLAVVAVSRNRNADALGWLEQVRTAGRSSEELADYHLWNAVVRGRLGQAKRARECLVEGEYAIMEAERTGVLAVTRVTESELSTIRILEQ